MHYRRTAPGEVNRLMRYSTLIPAAMGVLLLLSCCSVPFHEYPTIDPAYELTFPRDHFAHRDFRTEWWYYNGRLDAEDGAVYGFELVFFVRRTDMDKYGVIPISIYSNPAHLTHFSISDISENKYQYAEKRTADYITRGYDAGAMETAFNVWNEDWSAKEIGGAHYLKADMKHYDLSVALTPKKPFVLHGENGYFVKADGPEFPRGTYYISFTRLVGDGFLFVDGVPKKVRASAWMDHEFGSHQLAPGQLGWDWFSVQLDDGSDLMVYMLKQSDGSWGPLSKGTYVDADGNVRKLAKNEIRAEPLRTWKSKRTKSEYVVEWSLHILPLDMEIHIVPLMDDQEINSKRSTNVIYWEGIVKADGTRNGRPVSGTGYVELCGNAHPVTYLTKQAFDDDPADG